MCVLVATTNLALRKTTWQSSTYPNWPGSNAVDGDVGSCSATADNTDPRPWFVVDLGDWYRITRIVLSTRADYDGTYCL